MTPEQSTIITKCRDEALTHLAMATFMKRIGDYRSMDQHMEKAMNWSVHVDLLFHAAVNSGAKTYA